MYDRNDDGEEYKDNILKKTLLILVFIPFFA